GPGRVEIVSRAAGRVDFERVELIRNGEVVASAPTQPVGGHHEAELRITLQVDEPCWFALRTPPPSVPDDPDLTKRAPLKELGRERFAHPSPVYVTVARRPVFNRGVARELLEKMKRSRVFVAERGRFEDDLAKARVLDVYDDGISVLERRLAEE